MNMKSIYRKIAKEEGITPEEVKKQMQAAIDDAYLNANNTTEISHFQQSIPFQGKTPTPEELITSIAENFYSKKRG